MRDVKGSTARGIAGCAAFLAVAVAPVAARARERLVVAISMPGNPDLANSLTELAIAKVAERHGRDRDLVGLPELRDQIDAISPGGDVYACMASQPCLAQLRSSTGAERALIGKVREENDRFDVDLALVETRTPAAVCRFSQVVPAHLGLLISAVKEGVTDLIAREADTASACLVAASAPPPTLALRTPAAPAAAASLVASPVPAAAPRTKLAPYLGGAAGAGAIVSFSAAVVTGSLAAASPAGRTRAEMQVDLQHREQYASVANGALLLGGALAIASAAAFIWHWRKD